MKFKAKAYFIALIVLFNSCLSFSVTYSQINKLQAIKLAEEFIRRNGYTEMPIDTSKYKLSYTLNENMLFQLGHYTKDSVIRRRHNTLYPEAFCIGHSDSFKKWYIGFVSTSVQLHSLDSSQRNSDLDGKVINVSDDGFEIWMEHKMALFSLFEKL